MIILENGKEKERLIHGVEKYRMSILNSEEREKTNSWRGKERKFHSQKKKGGRKVQQVQKRKKDKFKKRKKIQTKKGKKRMTISERNR